MPRGRAKPPLVLTEEERETLERWARRPTTAQALAQRASRKIRGSAVAAKECKFGPVTAGGENSTTFVSSTQLSVAIE